MKTQTRLLTVIGITAVLVLALGAGGWLINTAFAQGPWQGGFMGMRHNNQAVLALLQTNESDLLKERQAGTSWLEIAKAKGVSELALTDALLEPVTQMSSWMTQNFPQSNTTQMTDWMRQQIAQDLGAAQYGTMTDMHVFGGSMMNGGMMGNWNSSNGYGGMMSGGMMGSGNDNNRFGGMMGGNGMMGNWNGNDGFGGMMNGGMMGGWNNTPNVNATPVPSTQKVDREIKINAQNFKFEPSQVQVKQGEIIKFTITNQDNFAHNAMSQNGKFVYTLLPANQATSIVWVASNQVGTYTVTCTFHPGMQFQIVVE